MADFPAEVYDRFIEKASWCTQEEVPLVFTEGAKQRLREMFEDGYSEDSAVETLRREGLL